MTLCEPGVLCPISWKLSKERDNTASTLLFSSRVTAFLATSQTRDCLLVNLESIAKGTDNTHTTDLKIQQKEGNEE